MKNNLKKTLILSTMIFSLSYAQKENILEFQTGSLQTFVETHRGNFSIFDKYQTDLDFVSFLFGGGSSPSSSFQISIDNDIETLDQMQTEYPLGNTLNSQIDGIFYAGIDRGVRVEVAYFSLDLLNSGDFNSVGVIINFSNVSYLDDRKIDVKFMLDTDIGESRNDPLVYSPDGEKLTNTTIYKNHIPKFLFFGRKNVAESRPIGTGFYLYPYVSDSLPSSVTVANWRRIMEDDITDSSFAYNRDSIKDVGVSIDFNNIYLNVGESRYVGFVISKQQGIATPVLSEDSVSKGVFNEERYEVEKILNQNNNSNNTKDNRQQRNQRFSSSNERRNLPDMISDDSVWGYLYQINGDMNQKDKNLDLFLTNTTSTNHTNNTIYKKQFNEGF